MRLRGEGQSVDTMFDGMVRTEHDMGNAQARNGDLGRRYAYTNMRMWWFETRLVNEFQQRRLTNDRAEFANNVLVAAAATTVPSTGRWPLPALLLFQPRIGIAHGGPSVHDSSHGRRGADVH